MMLAKCCAKTLVALPKKIFQNANASTVRAVDLPRVRQEHPMEGAAYLSCLFWLEEAGLVERVGSGGAVHWRRL